MRVLGVDPGTVVTGWGVLDSDRGRLVRVASGTIRVGRGEVSARLAAIYAGFTVLANGVGYPLEEVEQVLIGGAFGKYINVEKAVEIGLLPDMPWDRFHVLGNTAVLGAYRALLDRHTRERIQDIASRMTYVELSADNSFYDAFTSALFLPHTNLSLFPSVVDELEQIEKQRQVTPDV